jgi:hypothetical protein
MGDARYKGVLNTLLGSIVRCNGVLCVLALVHVLSPFWNFPHDCVCECVCVCVCVCVH